MKPFAFYGRVSTEDQQDPTTSRNWQLARSRSLIGPHGGEIVAEYFDIGTSRSLPWKRRPRATALLQALRDPDRGFDAVVIGEPARAFYGNQFSLTFPVFVHYGVGLWVPEVGGAVDPGSDAHDLVMSLYGGMSKGERNRIKIRVRSAMAAQAATEGRFLGGRPPYGYRLVDLGPHPNPGKAAAGQRRHGLEPDPVAAPVVKRIFREYVAGKGLYAIAEALTREGIACPSAHDRTRNRHRDGIAWSKSVVRAILRNPRYTGRQVWNRQRRDEVLIDVDDVAFGHETKQRWNPEGEWIWSADTVHEPLISPEVFEAAQLHARAGKQRAVDRKPRATGRTYALRRLIVCGLCGRRMQGSWIAGRARYRCRYPNEYGLANQIQHPRNIYVREDAILPRLDAWLGGLFDPENLDATVAALAAAGDDTTRAQIEHAERTLADCKQRLARYRAALEAGTDPAIIAQWSAKVQAEQARAENDLKRARQAHAPPPSRDELESLVRDASELVTILAYANPTDRRALYAALGLRLTYRPDRRRVVVECSPDDEDLGKSSCRRGCLVSGHREHMSRDMVNTSMVEVCDVAGAAGGHSGSGRGPVQGRSRPDLRDLPHLGARTRQTVRGPR